MRTIVVDDEPWMLKRFAIECEGIPDVQILGSFKNPVKALEFAREHVVELAFLDVEMPEMNGLQLADKLRDLYPGLIVIFVSAYEEYMTEAFKSKTADYYIMKPYDNGDIEAAIDRARLLSGRLRKKVFVRTFGSFEVFVDNRPVPFSDPETKELLALLIDKRGGLLAAEEAGRILWPEIPGQERDMRFYCVLRRLQESLKSARLDGIVDQNKEGAFVHKDIMDCDLYQFLDGDLKTMRQFFGEYLTNYAWAEGNRQRLLIQNELLGRYSDVQTRNTLCASIRSLNDPPLTLTYMNEGFLAVVGYTREEIMERFHGSLRAMMLREDFAPAVARGREMLHAGKAIEVEYRLVNKKGDEIWVLGKSEPPKRLSEGVYESSSILIDISGLKAEQYHLEQAAQRDGLTGLYNRASAQAKIRYYLASEGFTPSGALILMDVDNFKAVNDTYGHPFADTVLTDVAAILTRSFRASDIVCRLGGDEMMLFLKGVESEAAAREKLQAATQTLAERLSSKTKRGEISCSFGGVLCPEDGGDFETLYDRADLALYAAKEKKGCTVWFSDIRMRVVDKLIAREVTAIDAADGANVVPLPCNDRYDDFSSGGDLPQAVLSSLAKIGRQYDISRVYIFEVADDQPFAVNTFEWCAPYALPEIENLKELPTEALSPCYEAIFANDGLLYCYDVRTLCEPLYRIIEPQGIKSMLQCELRCENAFFGMVGFDECRERRYWNGRQIKALGDFAATLGKALYAYRQSHGRSLAALQRGAVGIRDEESGKSAQGNNDSMEEGSS